MIGIWGQPENTTLIKVHCSIYRQPIGKTRSKFPEKKFDLSPGSRGMVLQSIDSKWRNWKSMLKRKYHDPEKSIQSQFACPTEQELQKNKMNEKTTQLPPDSEDINAWMIFYLKFLDQISIEEFVRKYTYNEE
ncbi:hypothetical protein M9H77_17965 [Catharanthus roseus]|uniref:Uncharacterized protein n=1 Tax=Catharanthus roseus TaxID=4058 RepID=A0ACC0B654_CATRO|nr:hypothetical protein M9H77_17965 [Catharanthus roseus]